MKTFTVLALSMLAQAVGNTCVSKAMKHIGALHLSTDGFSMTVVVEALRSPMIWLGTFFLMIFFILFAAALSWADLSFVLPVSSFGYILNVAFAYHFLQEPVSHARWIGTVLIFLGVILVSRTPAMSPKEMGEP